MNKEQKIRLEKDPFLREIWAAGYDSIIEDITSWKIKLIRNRDSYIKEIDMFSLVEKPYKIIESILFDGTKHNWISEKDGSCDRFKDLIKPEIN